MGAVASIAYKMFGKDCPSSGLVPWPAAGLRYPFAPGIPMQGGPDGGCRAPPPAVFIACGGPGPARKRDAGVGGEEKAGRRRPPARPPAVLSLLSMPSVGINTALMGRCCYDACLQSGL